MELTEGRKDFLARRRSFIGGSDAPAIVGVSPWKGSLGVWAEKVGLAESEGSDEEFLELGTVLEPYVAQRYSKAHGGVEVICASEMPFQGLTRHPKYSFMGCHVDGLISHRTKGPGVLQIKTSGFDDGEWKDGAPLHYLVQHQHEMETAQVKWGVIAVLFGAPTFHTRFIEYESQPDLVGELIEAEAAFWKHVENKTEPTATALDLAVMRRLHGIRESEIELPPEALVFDKEIAEASDIIKAATERKDEAKARLLQLLGDNSRGVLPGRIGAWRRKENPAQSYHVDKKAYTDFRRVRA